MSRWSNTTPHSRFWDRVKKTDGCWERHAANNGCGYSFIEIDGKRKYAHRYSYELSFGTIPKGMFVLHKCDNPPCVKPDHLFIGTHSDNMRDCASKGRNGAQVFPRIGLNAPMSKFNRQQVISIRMRYYLGESQKNIGNYFGVTQSAIGSIVRGESYPDIPLIEDYKYDR